MSGDTLTFLESDLAATAAAYDPEKHKAPLVIGHPKDNAPAYGWTSALSFTDGLLKAVPDAVNQQFADWVNAGFYKKISASFYPPGASANPVPGVYYLRHIGFLGAQPPAVKGLPEPEFKECSFADGDTDFITLDFTEALMTTLTPEQIEAAKADLEKKQAELAQKEANFAEQQKTIQTQTVQLEAEKLIMRKKALTEFSETLIKEGRLLPKDKLGVVEFMQQFSLWKNALFYSSNLWTLKHIKSYGITL